ncbi:unnamed protein product [Sphenostylis stenocarpa]|uniref:Uncharacterized protein n=1 Tax=Sphenostylis stenocarpa TaxID=92480 RepID=A0AA86VX41_9FABA|nr:unnamed protein product [Sphenostylis stenocarpa]
MKEIEYGETRNSTAITKTTTTVYVPNKFQKRTYSCKNSPDSLQQGSTHGIGEEMFSANQLWLTGFVYKILKYGGSPTKHILMHLPHY